MPSSHSLRARSGRGRATPEALVGQDALMNSSANDDIGGTGGPDGEGDSETSGSDGPELPGVQPNLEDPDSEDDPKASASAAKSTSPGMAQGVDGGVSGDGVGRGSGEGGGPSRRVQLSSDKLVVPLMLEGLPRLKSVPSPQEAIKFCEAWHTYLDNVRDYNAQSGVVKLVAPSVLWGVPTAVRTACCVDINGSLDDLEETRFMEWVFSIAQRCYARARSWEQWAHPCLQEACEELEDISDFRTRCLTLFSICEAMDNRYGYHPVGIPDEEGYQPGFWDSGDMAKRRAQYLVRQITGNKPTEPSLQTLKRNLEDLWVDGHGAKQVRHDLRLMWDKAQPYLNSYESNLPMAYVRAKPKVTFLGKRSAPDAGASTSASSTLAKKAAKGGGGGQQGGGNRPGAGSGGGAGRGSGGRGGGSAGRGGRGGGNGGFKFPATAAPSPKVESRSRLSSVAEVVNAGDGAIAETRASHGCSFCHRKGHEALRCPKIEFDFRAAAARFFNLGDAVKTSFEQKQQQQPIDRNGNLRKQCQACGKYGHVVTACNAFADESAKFTMHAVFLMVYGGFSFDEAAELQGRDDVDISAHVNRDVSVGTPELEPRVAVISERPSPATQLGTGISSLRIRTLSVGIAEEPKL